MREGTHEKLVVLAAVIAAGSACAAIARSGGWGLLILTPWCLLAGLGQVVVNVRLAGHCALSQSPRLTKLALVSSGMFVLAFLLQVDEGDGPRWLIVTALLSPYGGGGSRLPEWWPIWVNWLAFVPLFVTWALMTRETWRAQANLQ